ncbi:MAG: DEAD/DEAH box helicase [Candidatus Acidiferrales bacterium]
MAFRKASKTKAVPSSPDQLLLDLPRRKIPNVLPHQREILQSFAPRLALPDVAMQMPTGSGKTLVALLIAEWLRRKNQDRVVYLCPTKQLVNQVVEQAEEKYGLNVRGFTGKILGYGAAAKAEYRNADRVAVTTYSSLFNTNPFFNDADVLILDDAHAAENYVAAMWSLRVERVKHAALHSALSGLFRQVLDPTEYTRLCGKWEHPADHGWVDKIPTPTCMKIREQIAEVIDMHYQDSAETEYAWPLIRGRLHACHIYLSGQEILIRPLIPPTWTHNPFSKPRQRIYMSATLGSGGDLERLTGRRSIERLPVPEGWDRQGVGRRFFMFPEMSLATDDAVELRRKLMAQSNRSLVLVPSDRLRESVAQDVAENLGFPTFSADDIEDSKKPFIKCRQAVAIVSGRYDGIDFPGSECRLLFIEGLPKAVNLQEKFLMSRMGANLLFNDRIQTRVLQAIGRCTRSLEDYSAVVVSGEELPDYLADPKRRRFFHPELQAELAFGIEQSKQTTSGDMLDNFTKFLENGKEWEDASQEIVELRRSANQLQFPAMQELRSVVVAEVEFQEKLWQGDFEGALEQAEEVLGKLTHPELRGYRALWHYLAGSAAASAADSSSNPALMAKARAQFSKAKAAATGLSWLVALSRISMPGPTQEPVDGALSEQLERVELLLAQLGTVHDRLFAEREKTIIDGLGSKDRFEQAHRLLGELLGFAAGKEETEGSPDPWWIAGDYCFVFEDHAGTGARPLLDVTKARQAASHRQWIEARFGSPAAARIFSVLVTPVTEVREAVALHLQSVSVWGLDGFKAWAKSAVAAIRSLRSTFTEPGDLPWRTKAAEVFRAGRCDAPSLAKFFEAQMARKILKITK